MSNLYLESQLLELPKTRRTSSRRHTDRGLLPYSSCQVGGRTGWGVHSPSRPVLPGVGMWLDPPSWLVVLEGRDLSHCIVIVGYTGPKNSTLPRHLSAAAVFWDRFPVHPAIGTPAPLSPWWGEQKRLQTLPCSRTTVEVGNNSEKYISYFHTSHDKCNKNAYQPCVATLLWHSGVCDEWVGIDYNRMFRISEKLSIDCNFLILIPLPSGQKGKSESSLVVIHSVFEIDHGFLFQRCWSRREESDSCEKR